MNYYKTIAEMKIARLNVDDLGTDDNMNINYLKTDDVPEYVSFVMKNPIEGGYGFLSSGSGSVDSIIVLKKPAYD